MRGFRWCANRSRGCNFRALKQRTYGQWLCRFCAEERRNAPDMQPLPPWPGTEVGGHLIKLSPLIDDEYQPSGR